MNIDTLIVFTARMDALAQFYAAGLGYDGAISERPGHRGFNLANGVYLGFDESDDARGSGGVSLWFEVEELDEAFDRFIEAGATIRYEKKHLPMGDTLASLFDPDGNVFGLVGQRTSDTDLVNEFLDTLADGRIDEWLALLTSDIVADTPFAPEGSPTRFEGLGEVSARFGDARKRMQSLRFFDRIVHPTTGGPVVVTCASEGIRGDGQPYENRYCWLFTVDEGRISHWVEYFDPQEVLRVRAQS